MIFTHKSNGSDYVQVAFKWQGVRRFVSFGHKSDMNLAAAKEYMTKIRQTRAEYAAGGKILPNNPPPPNKIPKLGKLAAAYRKATQDLMPSDLYMQIIEKHRQEGLSAEEHVRRLKNCEKNYAKLMSAHRQKIAEAQRKRLATIAAKKAVKFDHKSKPINAG